MPKLPITPEWLRAPVSGRPVGVDRKENVLRGYVVAQLGPFKTPGRGEFDLSALAKIVELINAEPKGLKSRFAHPTESDDGLGKYLGRAKNASLEGDRVRADLHLAEASFKAPSGNLGGYVLDLAEQDPDALSSSLVLKVDKTYRIDEKGRRLQGPDGEDLPPLWMPEELHSSDVVDTGDAVDGILSAHRSAHRLSVDELPDAVLRRACELLDQQFGGQSREVIQARCEAWLSRYLNWRYGESVGQAPPDSPTSHHDTEFYRRKIRAKELDGFSRRG